MISDPHKTVYIEIDKKRVLVWLYGDPKKPVIFFIHGYLRGYSDYIGDLPIRHLMNNYYLVAFDLPGFGKSKDITMNRLKFLEVIQDKILKNKKINIFGISYGGLIALKYSYKNKKKVNKIILAGMPYFSGIFKIFNIYLIVKHKSLYEEFKFLNREKLEKIKSPVLLYYNRADLIANIFMGKRIQEFLPNSKLLIYKNQNHKWLLHGIDKLGLASEIRKFLK